MWCVSLCVVVCLCVVCVGVVWVWCVVCCVGGVSVGCGTLKTPCLDSKRLHVYIQNVPVNAGNTRTCFSTCAHVAGTHGNVLNAHTGTF